MSERVVTIVGSFLKLINAYKEDFDHLPIRAVPGSWREISTGAFVCVHVLTLILLPFLCQAIFPQVLSLYLMWNYCKQLFGVSIDWKQRWAEGFK